MATAWGRYLLVGGGGLEKGSKEWTRQQRRQTATRALKVMANIGTSPLMPQQVAVLVSGSLLLCSWRFMSQRLQQFEQRGLWSIMEVWVCMAAALGLGQLVRVVARNSARGLAGSYSVVGQAAGIANSSNVPYMHGRAGQESGSVPQVVAAEDSEDVGVQKRIAQAAAAAELAKYQQGLRQLLSDINKTGNLADDAQLLYQLADQLFSSPLNVCELVGQGGVPVILSAARSALQAMAGDAARVGAVLPALMQLSWVLLQVAHGPPACFAALAEQQDVACTLLGVIESVLAAPGLHLEAKESTLRNLSWILLVLCDPSRHCELNQHGSSSTSSGISGTDGAAAAAACASALVSAGAVEVLQQLVSLRFGASAGWVAAATLGLFMQLGHKLHENQQYLQQHHAPEQQQQCVPEQQQQQLLVPPQVLRQTSVSAMLQPDSLHGVAYLLHHQPQLSERLRGLVSDLLHYLLTFHSSELLQLLVEEQLVGSVASGVSLKLGRLLVCQLISLRGQEVMNQIEASYELAVPMALAQVVPLPVHLKLPPAPVPQQQQQQQQQAGEIQPEVAAAVAPEQQQVQQQQQQQVVEDVYTDVLACRLLLQHSRLDELLTAFKDELCGGHAELVDPAAAAVAAVAAGNSGCLSPVCEAVLKLMQHLMSRDLELSAVYHERGDSIDESLSSSVSSSNSSVIDAALAMPDACGVYSAVMSGLVPESELPPPAAAAGEPGSHCRSNSSSSLLALPALLATAGEPCSGCSGKRSRSVVFEFGPLQHSVSHCTYKGIKCSSKFVASILRREQPKLGSPVRLLTVPHFTHEANAWVLRCLERWVISGSLQGFSAAQASKLWVAADFLQVDGLQVACEDAVLAAAAQDASQLEVALELCARHRASSARLQRLAVRVVLRSLVAPQAPAAGSSAAAAAAAAAGSDASHLASLAALMQRHTDVLLPGLLAEVRDRLVTLCMLNAGLDDDTPDDDVE